MNSPPKQHGFTLLEVVVVLFVVGLIATMVVLNARPGEQRENLEEELLRLQGLISLADQEAMATSQPLGLSFRPDGYRFHYWNGTDWQDATEDGPWRQRELPKPMTLKLWLTESGEIDLKKITLAPHVTITPGGEHTPFNLELRGSRTLALRLTGDLLGGLTWTTLGENTEMPR